MRLIDLARPVAKAAFVAADIFRAVPPGPRILIYHQVAHGTGRQMEVTPRQFARQLDWLQEHGEIIDLDAALGRRVEQDADRLFVLTFDDGYRDVYENAFPLMRSRRIPFTLYLATESIETGNPLTPGVGADPLSWSQIGEMYDTGLLTVGNHTHRHIDLRGTSTSDTEAELDEAQELIRRRLGLEARHFAYPWGYWDESAHELVTDRFATAVLGSGSPVTADRSPHLLNRVPIQLADMGPFFRAKLKTGMVLEDRLRRRLRGYSGY